MFRDGFEQDDRFRRARRGRDGQSQHSDQPGHEDALGHGDKRGRGDGQSHGGWPAGSPDVSDDPGSRYSARARRNRAAQPKWSRREVIAALRAARREVGEPFTAGDYSRWKFERELMGREVGADLGRFPSVRVVQVLFRSWADAVREADDR